MFRLAEHSPRSPLWHPDAAGGSASARRSIDTNRVLSRWYNRQTTYIEGMEVTGGGIYVARFTFDPSTHSAAGEKFKSAGGFSLGDGTNHTLVKIGAENLIGHTWALPLHKQVRIMTDNITIIYQRGTGKRDTGLKLAGYRTLSSRKAITSGMKVEVVGRFTETNAETSIGPADAYIEIPGKDNASELKGMLFKETPPEDKGALLEDQVLEAKAQAVVCALYGNQEIAENMVPLFGGTRQTRFVRRLRPGETALFIVTKLQTRRGGFFSADVQTVSSENQEDEIAQSQSVFGTLAPKDEVLEALAA